MNRAVYLILQLIICMHLCHGVSSFDSTDIGLDIYKYLNKYNYTLEEHTVTTEDGYILKLHRITTGRNGIYATEGKPPVLLVHGLGSSSMDYVNYGPGRSIGLMLADGGYDVWLANCRGNTWSRNHKNLDPTTREFYQFSYHEIGYYDLPAKIDYILQKTNKDQLSYIGHSQGGTTFFILGCTRPEYMKKINVMAGLAPAVLMSDVSNPLIRLAAQPIVTLALGFLLEAVKMHLVVPHYDIFTEFAHLCQDDNIKYICQMGYYLIGGIDEEQMEDGIVPIALSNAPAGISYKQLLHFAQAIRTGTFGPLDFGLTVNRQKYGKQKPGNYNLGKNILPPVKIYYGAGDTLVAPTNTEQLKNILPNVELKLINATNFMHLDFLWSKDIVELLNNDIVALMNKYNDVKVTTTGPSSSEITTEAASSNPTTPQKPETSSVTTPQKPETTASENPETSSIKPDTDSATSISGNVMIFGLLLLHIFFKNY